METGLALYTAVLCRSAGFTDCPEFEGFERPALPEGADLGTLLVDFLYPESKNPRGRRKAAVRGGGRGGGGRGGHLRSGTDPGCR